MYSVQFALTRYGLRYDQFSIEHTKVRIRVYELPDREIRQAPLQIEHFLVLSEQPIVVAIKTRSIQGSKESVRLVRSSKGSKWKWTSDEVRIRRPDLE